VCEEALRVCRLKEAVVPLSEGIVEVVEGVLSFMHAKVLDNMKISFDRDLIQQRK